MEQDSLETERQSKPAYTRVQNTSTPEPDTAHSMAIDGELPQSSRRSKSLVQSCAQPSLPKQQIGSVSQASNDVNGALDSAHRQYDQEDCHRDENSKAQPRTENVSLSSHFPSQKSVISRNLVRAYYDENLENPEKIKGDDNEAKSTPNYLHYCPGHPKYCSYRNQKPALKTKNTIIYDLPAYVTRREINRRRNLRNLSLNYGPELGPPISACDNNVHVLGPDETSISVDEVQKQARVVSWLVEHIPTICPEWHVRSAVGISFKMSATKLVWDMNQKWAVDVPHHQMMGALRQLRAGLKDDDIDLMEDNESLESVDIPRTTVHKSVDSEEEDAARLMASFTAPMNRKSRRSPVQSNKNSSSIWHVEDRRWGSDNGNYEDDGDEGYLDIIPAYDEDSELDLSSQMGEDHARDEGMHIDSNNDDDIVGYNTTLVDDTSRLSAPGPHRNEDANISRHRKNRSTDTKEAYFISLLRGYLDLGLTNTTLRSGPLAEISQRTPQQEHVRLLEQGIEDLEGGRGVDENLLKFVIERCAAY
ncbi:MAG: hypothetical protein Q9160_000398 [Pyrenula sp. 1 TL-2023]